MKEEMKKALAAPEALISFNSTESKEFEEFLDDLKDLDVLENIDLSQIALKEQAGELWLENTATGEIYRVIPTSYFSVIRRAEDTAPILTKMTPEQKAAHINMSWPLLKGKTAQMITCCGNLKGLHSERYVVIRPADLFSHMRGKMKLDYDEVTFVSGIYRHDMLSGTYEVKDAALAKAYINELNSMGKTAEAGSLQFFVTLQTSDSADSSIWVMPEMQMTGTLPFPICKPEGLPHRDGTSLIDADALFARTFALIEDASEHLKSMMNIELKHPECVLAAVVKKFRLPVKLIRPIGHHFEVPGGTMSAHDFYLELSRFFEDPRFGDKPVKEQIEEKSNLAKLMLLSDAEWMKYDIPGKTLFD